MDRYAARRVNPLAMTKEEHEDLEKSLGRPVTWKPRHRHSTEQALIVQKLDVSGGTNQVPKQRSTQ